MMLQVWSLVVLRSFTSDAGFYMHPTMADCTLHLSLVGNNDSPKPLEVSIPVSLGAFPIPGRRNGLLRASWAAAASSSVLGAADITGNMTLSAAPHEKDVAPLDLQFVRLTSRAISAGKAHLGSQKAAAGQVHRQQYAQHCSSVPL